MDKLRPFHCHEDRHGGDEEGIPDGAGPGYDQHNGDQNKSGRDADAQIAPFGRIRWKRSHVLHHSAGLHSDSAEAAVTRKIAFNGALEELLPQIPPDLFMTPYAKELEEWAAMGVTTVATRLKAADITTYADLDRRGQLPIRIAYIHQIGWWNPMPDRDLWNMGGLQNHGTDMLWLTGITPSPPDDAVDSEGGVCSTAPKLRSIVTDAVAKEISRGIYWGLGISAIPLGGIALLVGACIGCIALMQ